MRGNDAAFIVCLASFFILIFTAFPASAATTEVLTLRASVDRAEKNNPKLQLASKEFQIARAQLRQARSLFFPRVNLNMDAVRYKQDTIGQIPPELGNVVLETSKQSNVSGADNLYIGRLNLVQTLYAGGKVTYTYRLSQINVQRAQSALEAMQNQVEFDTEDAFYGLVALKEKRKLMQDALLDVEKMAKQAPGEHARLQAASERAELRRNLSELDLKAQDLRFAYLKVMGVEYFSDVDVDGKLETPAKPRDLQTVLVWARENRPELRETAIQEEVDALSVDLSLAERYPTLRLGGGVEVRNREFPLDQTNWNAVLDMNIPIFDGLSSPARVKESRYRAEQGRLRRAQLEDAIEMEVRAAHADIQHWTDELAARTGDLADLNGSSKSYVGPNRNNEPLSQRLDFLRWRLERSVDVIDAQLQLSIANARLTRAVGKSPSEARE